MNIFQLGFGIKAVVKNFCDIKIIINSSNVAKIQEYHKFLGHTIIESVENKIS